MEMAPTCVIDTRVANPRIVLCDRFRAKDITHAIMSTSDDPSPAPSGEPIAKRRIRVPRPRVPRERTRQEGGVCGNCGFHDTGHYCSRCGEPLHGIEESVLEILWSDLVEGPLHNLFALAKTTWLMLLHPHQFFHGVLRRQRALSGFPFFLAPAWRRVSHKPHGVPNAVKYFVLIFTISLLTALLFGVRLVPDIPVSLLGGEPLPGTFAEPLFLLFMVVSASMYAFAMSKLLGGRIETELLTRFMLYLNGFALIPFVGMGIAGTEHPWIFLVLGLFWLYVLFVLPQVALPRLFGLSRWRLAIAQGGAAVANVLAILLMFVVADALADRMGIERRQRVPALATTPLTPVVSGAQAWRQRVDAGEIPGVLPFTLRDWVEKLVPDSTSRAAQPAGAGGETLFPRDSAASPVDALARVFAELDSATRRGLRGRNAP